MTRNDVATLMKSVGFVVREYVALTLSGIAARLEMLEEGLKAIPSGPPGEAGPRGERGERGVEGKDGRDGRDGKDGRDGDSGRDALAIDILPGVDLRKSYPRATYAAYNGGIIHSVRPTRAIDEGFEDSGWEILVDGVAELLVHQGPDPREFSVHCVRTSGQLSVSTMYLPVVIYQQVFQEGTTYRQGDMVTWGGSLWHCNQDTQSKPGESNKHWTLAVKEGRRGKDGADGAPGERGPEGRPGKDLTQMDFDGRKH